MVSNVNSVGVAGLGLLAFGGILFTTMVEMRCTVTGKVQGVRYRDYVVSMAEELGVFGYVQNQSDGSVLVVAQGEPDTLKEMVECLHEGSLLARVDGVAVDWGTANATYDEFSLLQ